MGKGRCILLVCVPRTLNSYRGEDEVILRQCIHKKVPDSCEFLIKVESVFQVNFLPSLVYLFNYSDHHFLRIFRVQWKDIDEQYLMGVYPISVSIKAVMKNGRRRRLPHDLGIISVTFLDFLRQFRDSLSKLNNMFYMPKLRLCRDFLSKKILIFFSRLL